MTKKRINKDNKTIKLILIAAICYILIVIFIPHIRIAVLKVDELCINVLNVLLQFALAFVSAYIFWHITVCLKEKRVRAEYSWWIHDKLLKTVNMARDCLSLCGADKTFTVEDVKNTFIDGEEADSNIHSLNSNIKKMDSFVSTLLGGNIPWNEQEIIELCNIHDACYGILDIASATIVREQAEPLFKLIKQLEDAAYNLDKIAASAV